MKELVFKARTDPAKFTMTMLFTMAEERNLVAEKYGAVEGLKQNMEKLNEYLAKM